MRYTPQQYAEQINKITSILLEANTAIMQIQTQLEDSDQPMIPKYLEATSRKILEIVHINQNLQDRLSAL
jgi:hypothetical protein